MPFAGRYVLGGQKSELENRRAKIELEDALIYYEDSSDVNQDLHKGVILNQNSVFDLTTGKPNQKYIPVNKEEKNDYIETYLSKKKYDYEYDNSPSLEQLLELIPNCFERFERKRKQLNFFSNTQIFIMLPEDKILNLSCKGDPPKIISKENVEKSVQYLTIDTDFRLLLRLFSGPQFAHWNNAEIGSHLKFDRKPNVYERGLFYCLNFFHN